MFSFIGPLIGSIFGIIFLIITVFVLSLVNVFLGSTFISALINFFNSNLDLFFFASLVLGYGKYIAKNIKPFRVIVSPLVGVGGFVFALWILANIFLAINVSANISLIQTIANLLLGNLINIFVVLIVFAYLMKLLWFFVREIYW